MGFEPWTEDLSKLPTVLRKASVHGKKDPATAQQPLGNGGREMQTIDLNDTRHT